MRGRGIQLGALVWIVSGALASPAPADQSQGDPRLDYMLQCQGCHGAEGHAQPEADIPSLIDLAPRFLPSDEGRDYLLRVPGVMQAPLSDKALARLMNWVLGRFTRREPPTGFAPYTAAEVSRARERGPIDVAKTRARLLDRP